MTAPPEFPPLLRALLDAELAAGNEIVEIASFPAPPAGAYVKLARPVTTRPRESADGISFYDRDTSIYSGEFTDSKRFYFVLEPPNAPPPEPDMDAIRAGLRARQGMAPETPAPRPQPSQPAASNESTPTPLSAPPSVPPRADTAVERFARSMVIDYEKWHDGIGYDLDILRAASPEELVEIERILVRRGARDWRDVEALAALGSPRAKVALRAALKSRDHQVRTAVHEHAPELMSDAERAASLVQALESADFYGGLTQTLDQVAAFHPPEIVQALFRGVRARDGEVAVHFAALLMFLHGKASSPFDMAQRPFFLRFNTADRAEREQAFRELCERIGVEI